KAESAEIVVAGGMESMTNAPHLSYVRKGIRYGAAQLYDHMAIDGLEDAYDRGRAMGVFAEECVDKYKFTREAMDRFAIMSTERSKKANEDGSFDWEMAPVSVPAKGGETVIKFDEQPFKARLDKIPGLKPAFKKDGAITAATSSSISDGAAALVLMDIQLPDIDGIEALRRIREVRELDAMPVVAVSASVMPDDQQKIVTSGFDAFVTKPIHLKHFVDTVKRFLDGGEARP